MEPSRKEQIFIVTTVAVLLLGGVAFGVAQFFWMGAPAQLPASTVAINRSMSVSSPMISPAIVINGDALSQFNKTYRLADNENVKRLPKPYIPERDLFIRSQGSSSSIMPTFIIWRWDGSKVAMGLRGPATTSNFRLSINMLLNYVAGLQPPQYEIPAEFMSLDLIGDWIFRQTATEEQKMQALGPIIGSIAGKKVHFNKQQIDRDTITASGQYTFKALEDVPDSTSILLFLDKADLANAGNAPVSSGNMSISDLVRTIGSLTNTQITSEAQGDVSTPVPVRLYMQSLTPVRTPGPQHDEALKKLLDNVSQQTGLTFTHSTHKVDAWALVPD